MDIHTATEEAYKKGYEQGKKDAVVHARWDDSFDGITPYCTNCGRSHREMNRTPDNCPHCGAKMDGDGNG